VLADYRPAHSSHRFLPVGPDTMKGAMKRLEITRYNSNNPHTCSNGDVYDSTAILYNDDENYPAGIWRSDTVNVDSTNGYDGGRLKPGKYYGIVGHRQPKNGMDGKRVIKLFLPYSWKNITDYTNAYQLTEQDVTLPSEIPNRNHKYSYQIAYVQIHSGGESWDWSHGCITIYDGEKNYSVLMGLVQDNEILEVILT
jgi:hypothetical protein